jgi:hypothetical protein
MLKRGWGGSAGVRGEAKKIGAGKRGRRLGGDNKGWKVRTSLAVRMKTGMQHFGFEADFTQICQSSWTCQSSWLKYDKKIARYD